MASPCPPTGPALAAHAKEVPTDVARLSERRIRARVNEGIVTGPGLDEIFVSTA